MNAQLGRFRRQRKQERIIHGLPSISTTHDGERAEFFVCCGSELFLAKPTAFFAGAVLQKRRWTGVA